MNRIHFIHFLLGDKNKSIYTRSDTSRGMRFILNTAFKAKTLPNPFQMNENMRKQG